MIEPSKVESYKHKVHIIHTKSIRFPTDQKWNLTRVRHLTDREWNLTCAKHTLHAAHSAHCSMLTQRTAQCAAYRTYHSFSHKSRQYIHTLLLRMFPRLEKFASTQKCSLSSQPLKEGSSQVCPIRSALWCFSHCDGIFHLFPTLHCSVFRAMPLCFQLLAKMKIHKLCGIKQAPACQRYLPKNLQWTF